MVGDFRTIAIGQRWRLSGLSAEPSTGALTSSTNESRQIRDRLCGRGPGEGSDLGRWARPGSGELTGMAVRRGVFHAVPDLIASIEKYMAWTRM